MPTFQITEFFPGMGTLCSPFVEGLSAFGSVSIGGAVELDGRYLSMYSQQHPEASTALGSVLNYAPEEVVFPATSPGVVSVFLAGIPCTGASKSGRSKNHLAAAEMHPDVGALFLPFLHRITLALPDIVVVENVPDYAKTVSAGMIRDHLARLGYFLHERVVNPFKEFSTPTERVRWIMVATRGRRFSWDYTAVPFSGTIEEFLDPISLQDSDDEFSESQVSAHTAYCDRKAREGCGFARRIMERSSGKVPTFCKSYGKVQPTSTFLKSGSSYRMFRPMEIARLHGFGPDFVRTIGTLPKTVAYEVLGQGVVAKPFRSLGRAIGEWIAAGQN